MAVQAPMDGALAALHVKPGDAVRRGQPLAIIEAMKMEHPVEAPQQGPCWPCERRPAPPYAPAPRWC